MCMDDYPPGHGIAGGQYVGGPGDNYYLLKLGCTCGWTTGRCAIWQTAEAKFDRHLKEKADESQLRGK